MSREKEKCEPTGERLFFFLRDSMGFGITLFPLSAWLS
jgi:hypothetical protein